MPSFRISGFVLISVSGKWPEEYVESQAEDAESHEYDCGKEYFH